jgi:hypothetical protein
MESQGKPVLGLAQNRFLSGWYFQALAGCRCRLTMLRTNPDQPPDF